MGPVTTLTPFWITLWNRELLVVRAITLRVRFGGFRDRGGIGRRASLRSWWGNPWGFESLRSHDCKGSEGW